MTVTEAFTLLRSHGLKLRVAADGAAEIGPKSKISPYELALFRAHAAGLVALLKPPPAARPGIILLADTPGRDDSQLLDEYGLHPAGLSRGDLLLKYILPPGAAAQDLTPADVAAYVDALHRRLAALPAPAVLVPTGPLGLAALRHAPLPTKPAKQPTKKHRPSVAGPTWRLKGGAIAWPDTISATRGFVDGYVDDRGRTHTVVATYPATTLWSNPKIFDDLQADWKRIAAEAAHPGEIPPTGVDAVARTSADLRELLRRAAQAPLLAFDIETDRRRTIYCCGFATDADHAMTVPLVVAPEHGWTAEFIAQCWATVRALLALPVPKVAHNILFDVGHLALSQSPPVAVAAPDWCTLAMHHQVNPNRPHGLAYAASRDLRVTSWKGTSKEEETGSRGGVKVVQTKNLMQLATYCGADCRRAWALQRVLEGQLTDLDMLETYAAHHRAVNAACLDLLQVGLPVDDAARQRHVERLDAELVRLRAAMQAETGGIDLVATKALSPMRVAAYLYGPPPAGLGCEVTHTTDTGNPATNEIAVRRLMLRYPRVEAIGTMLLAYASAAHLRAFVDASRVDTDGRMRSLYRPVAKSGRCRSAETPLKTGTNAQNYPHELRDIFVAAHPGWLLVQLDLSTAESRIVDGCSSDPRGLELARTSPAILDQHAQLAAEVLGKPLAEVTKEERQVVGKKGRHGMNYAMRGATMSDALLKETESRIVRSPEECQAILDGVLAARPYIRRWQEHVWEAGQRGELVNSWGCRYLTERFEVTSAMRREWLPWGPQGEVARLLTQKGWLRARKLIRRDGLRTEIVHQGHDSLVLHGPVEELFDLCVAVEQSLSAPRTYPGVEHPWELCMPVGWGLGHTLGALHEWKVAPSRAEFMEVAWAIAGSTAPALAPRRTVGGARPGRRAESAPGPPSKPHAVVVAVAEATG
jgi:DNA polymerase I-like protein with 3'-5' exonuclease and polymerase domains